jgi:hypothetical protein
MKAKILPEIVEIVNGLKDYWGLTLRQIYYQLVSRELIENKQTEYKSLSRLLVKAREDGLLDWQAMEDRTRAHYGTSNLFCSAAHYIQHDIDVFADSRYYMRDLQQGQPRYIEIWIEKDALSSIFKKVADRYSIPLTVCKGYPSRTFLNNFKTRANGKLENSLILYFGDLDPSGLNIFDTTREYFLKSLDGFDMTRIALTEQQVHDYNLPHSPEAIKSKDSRTKAYVKKYGMYAVELDALQPDALANIVNTAILSSIDIDMYDMQLSNYRQDIKRIETCREKAFGFLNRLKY